MKVILSTVHELIEKYATTYDLKFRKNNIFNFLKRKKKNSKEQDRLHIPLKFRINVFNMFKITNLQI